MGNATLAAQVVVDELAAGGVREVVLAPGSRSAPLALALAAADRAGQLRLHVRIDERTAGFLALGLAKASESPVAVLTTSGTAAANLHPAALEAWHSHLPLVLLTADRPRGLVNTGANQTTHQSQLFAGHVRAYAGLSDAGSEDGGAAPRSWRFEVTRLLAAARGARTGLPGPVHLNVELSDPLTEVATPLPGGRPSTAVVPLGLSAAPTVLPAGPRTVVVAGDAPPAVGRAAAAQAAAAGLPLLAEPSSNARQGPTAIATYRLLLGGGWADSVERVVVFGHPTLSRPVLRLLSRPEVELVVVSPYADWPDPGQVASVVTDAVTFAAAEPGNRGDWLATWQRADAELRRRLDDLLAAQPTFTGPALAGALWSALGADDVLLLGASNPIRDVDLAPISASPPQVYASRGLSGIDGNISTAAGIALARRRPTHALLGDVTAVHDLTGLVIGPGEPRPDLRLVVANDDGGSIFATLEQGGPDYQDAFERVFATPHAVAFAAVAAAVGAGYRQVRSTAELITALSGPPTGLEIVEAVIDRVDRRRLDQAVTALAATL